MKNNPPVNALKPDPLLEKAKEYFRKSHAQPIIDKGYTPSFHYGFEEHIVNAYLAGASNSSDRIKQLEDALRECQKNSNL